MKNIRERKDIGEFIIDNRGEGLTRFTRGTFGSTKSSYMDLNIRYMEFVLGLQKWLHNDGYIQDIFPGLNADEREFIVSGLTPEAWNKIFGEEEEDNNDNELSEEPGR